MSIDLTAALAKRFSPLALDTSPGIVIELFGGPGTGKTDFALRAPAPVLHFGFDYHGARRPANRLMNAYPDQMKHVHTKVYPMKPRDRKAEPDEVAQRAMRDEVLVPFIQDFEFAVENGVRSLVIDTFDMMREAQVIAKFGKLEQNSQQAYQEINAETARLLHLARGSELVVILISRMKEEYKEVRVGDKMVSKSTGKMIPASNLRVQHSVDARLETYMEGKEFMLRIYDAKTNKGVTGKTFEAPEVAPILQQLKPDVDCAAWA